MLKENKKDLSTMKFPLLPLSTQEKKKKVQQQQTNKQTKKPQGTEYTYPTRERKQK